MKNILLLCLLLTSSWASANFSFPIYDQDNRIELELYHDTAFLDLGKSVAAYVHVRHLKPFNDSTIQIEAPSLKQKFNLCPEERFLDQPAFADCSGVLIAPRLILTAGHCVPLGECRPRHRWIFGITASSTTLPGNEIYNCQKVVAYKYDHTTLDDFAIVQLDRNVINRTPLKLRSDTAVSLGESLTMLGHGLHLPLMVTDSAQVIANQNNYFFVADFDSFDGNSGSPVFDNNLEVAGILVRGETDFELDAKRQCNKIRRIKADEAHGENIIRINTLMPTINTILSAGQE